jgi:hypothetical protein
MNKQNPNAKKVITKDQAIEKLWRAGVLSWKLRGKQIDIYNHFKNSKEDIVSCLISRQFGKSVVLLLIATELCINKAGAIVKYACPTQKMVERIIKPRMRMLIQDCPVDMRPEWKSQEKIWLFPNGSEIQVAGTDNDNYDALRGGSSDLCICDEAAFMNPLEEIVFSVLAPTTDTLNGKVYLASTPNDKDSNHPFHELFIHPAEASGKLLKMTFYDSPMIDDAQREKIIKRYPGGINNIKFRCEYLVEIPNVTDNNVVPEFAKVETEIVKEVPATDYCDFYTAADVGFTDLCVFLFSYYDYSKGCLVVLDEYVVNGPEVTSSKINDEVLHHEKLNYTTSIGITKPPYLRVMDNNLLLINDLSKFHKLTFIPTEKHGKEEAVDTVRRWIESKKIVIHPRCKNLIYHLKYAQWQYTKAGTYTGKFKHLAESQDNTLKRSHADALDALIYLVRNVQTSKNPYPKGYGYNINSNTFISPKHNNQQSQVAEFMGKLLNFKKK